jgi:hypothetical protein
VTVTCRLSLYRRGPLSRGRDREARAAMDHREAAVQVDPVLVILF